MLESACYEVAIRLPSNHHLSAAPPRPYISGLCSSAFYPRLCCFFFLRDWGILSLALAFGLTQAFIPSASVRKLGWPSRRHGAGVGGSLGIINHRRAVCALRGGCWDPPDFHLLNKCSPGSGGSQGHATYLGCCEE